MSRFGDTALPFHYIAYIDEAGDPGIDSIQPKDPRGPSTEELDFLSEEDKDWVMGRAVLARVGWS